MKITIQTVKNFNASHSGIVQFTYCGKLRKHGYILSKFYDEGGISHSFYKTKRDAILNQS